MTVNAGFMWQKSGKVPQSSEYGKGVLVALNSDDFLTCVGVLALS